MQRHWRDCKRYRGLRPEPKAHTTRGRVSSPATSSIPQPMLLCQARAGNGCNSDVSGRCGARPQGGAGCVAGRGRDQRAARGPGRPLGGKVHMGPSGGHWSPPATPSGRPSAKPKDASSSARRRRVRFPLRILPEVSEPPGGYGRPQAARRRWHERLPPRQVGAFGSSALSRPPTRRADAKETKGGPGGEAPGGSSCLAATARGAGVRRGGGARER